MISVIVVNWNGRQYLERCIDSVSVSNYPRDQLEIIIVDNASKDGSALAAKRKYPEICLVENHSNLGFCEGNNIGIRICKGDIVVLLNNDVEVDRNWLSEISQAAIAEEVGVVGCKLVFGLTDIIQTVGFRISESGRQVSLFAGERDSTPLPRILDVDYVSGAALAIKKSVLQEVGLLDPFYFAYNEDMDLCYRVRQSGRRVVVATNAIVHHYASQSWKRRPIKQIFLVQRNSLYFKLKFFRGLSLAEMLVYWPLHDALTDMVKLLTRKSVVQAMKKRSQETSDFAPSVASATLSTMAGWLIFCALLSIWPVYHELRISSKHNNLGKSV